MIQIEAHTIKDGKIMLSIDKNVNIDLSICEAKELIRVLDRAIKK